MCPRKGALRWGRVDARHRSPVVGGDVTGRPALEVSEGVMMETGPYLGLPLGIETFNSSLKAGLPWGREHGHDLQGETEPDDTAHRIRVLMGPLKARIVVELDKGR